MTRRLPEAKVKLKTRPPPRLSGWSDESNETAEWIVAAVANATENEHWIDEFEQFNRADAAVSRAYKFLAMKVRRLQGR